MSAEHGVAAAHEFIEAFNAQDHERLAASLNYPHIRLARTFTRFENARKFAETQPSGGRLPAAGGLASTRRSHPSKPSR